KFVLNSYALEEVEVPGMGTMLKPTAPLAAHRLEAGSPVALKFSTPVIAPPTGTYALEVLSFAEDTYPNIELASSKGNFDRNTNPVDVPYSFGPEYLVNAYSPVQRAQLGEYYIAGHRRATTFQVNPTQYNPVTKELIVTTELVARITIATTDGGDNVQLQAPVPRRSRVFKRLDTRYLNYEVVMAREENDTRFEYLSEHGNMLIISHGAFMDEMQDLVDWKNLKGVPTEMVDVTDIGSNSSAIKSYIEEYYYDHGLTYLLLVGDVAQIPTPIVNGNASDPSYGFIDGNDSYAEVIVGRFSGSSPAQIATQVERSIEYERYPHSGEDAGWYDDAMGIASNQGPGIDGYDDDDFLDFLWDTVLEPFTYDSYQFSYDGSGSVSQGMAVINNGVSLINYCGHGSQFSWGNGAALSTSNINSLENDNMLPFVVSVACNVGEFNTTNECFAEATLRATHDGEPTGAIAHMGSSISMSWVPPQHGQYGMNIILTGSYNEGISHTLGGIATNGCMYMNDMQGNSGINETKHWIFFGDPTVPIRTAPPTQMTVEHAETITEGDTEFVVVTQAEGDLVALSHNGALLAAAYTSDENEAVLDLSSQNLPLGTYDLVVTGFNTFPYETEVIVVGEDDCVSGDANGDGEVNILDLVALANFVLSGAQVPDSGCTVSVDPNGDGRINIQDIILAVNTILEND
ncbi:MAG: C25 family cysteine peptidase, partial [Myxococcota bacterium]|nr:C25 family cysteine peptidase [Myxococcota bacterium]